MGKVEGSSCNTVSFILYEGPMEGATLSFHTNKGNMRGITDVVVMRRK